MTAKTNEKLLNRIFESVRKENAIIWAGAGVSLQAGFPSGIKLGKTFLGDLNDKERSYFDNKTSLLDITEEYVQIKGRDSAIKILKREFNNEGGESTFHSTLSKIPHIKTIITTNYDNLFERDYKGLISTAIINSEDITDGITGNVQLLKVHGDLNALESLIITKSDYDNFFLYNKQDNAVWDLIKERFITKDIVFVGYGFEDSNVSVVYQSIKAKVGKKSKKAYLLAPNLPEHRIKKLRESGIQYINITGEDFIIQLHQDLKDNIYSDFDNNWVNAETFRMFCFNHNLSPTIEGSPNGYTVKSVSIREGRGIGDFHLKLPKNSEVAKSFVNFVQGRSNDELKISGKDLEYFSFSMQGVRINELLQGHGELTFKRNPKTRGKFDIIFDEDFDLLDLEYEYFASVKLIEIKTSILTMDLKIKIIPKDLDQDIHLKVDFEHSDICNSTIEELQLLKTLERMSSEKEFKITWDGNTISRTLKDLRLLEAFSHHKQYIEALREVEKFYHLRFKKFPCVLNEEDSFSLNVFYEIMTTGGVTLEGDFVLEGELEFINDSLNELKKENAPFESVNVTQEITEEIDLFGKKVNVNFSGIEYFDAQLVNIYDLISGKTKVSKLVSKTKRFYTKRNQID